MLKRYRILLLIAAAGLALAFVSWHIRFVEVPLRTALERMTGEPVSFVRVSFRPFNRCTIDNLTVGNFFSSERATVYLNPFALFRNPTHPERSLVSVHLEGPNVVHTPELESFARRMARTPASPDDVSLKIAWENGKIAEKTIVVSRSSGRIRVGRGIDGMVTGFFGSKKLSITFESRKEGSGADFDVRSKVAGDSTDVLMDIHGRMNEGSCDATLTVPRFIAGDIDLSSSTATFRYSKEGVVGKFLGPAGSGTLSGPDFDALTLDAAIAISSFTPVAAGSLTIHAEKMKDRITGTLKVTDASLRGSYLGSIDLSMYNVGVSTWVGRGTLAPAGYSFSAVLREGKVFSVFLQSGAKGFAKIEGTLSPLKITAKASEWPLDKAPLLNGIYPGIHGTITFDGLLSPREYKLTLSARDLAVRDAVPLSLDARVIQKDGNWFIESETDDGRMTASCRKTVSGGWQLNSSFNDFDLATLAAWSRRNYPLRGKVSGSASYAAPRRGKIDLLLNDMYWNDVFLGQGKIDGSLTDEAAQLRQIVLHSGKGTLSGNGELNFAKERQQGRLSLNFHRFPVYGNELHGKLTLTGNIDGNARAPFYGQLASRSFRINQWSTDNLSAELSLSSEKLEVRDFQWWPFARGAITVNLKKKSMHGKGTLIDIPLDHLSRDIRGTLRGEVTVSGHMANPLVILRYESSDTRFRSLLFRHSGTILARNGNVLAEKVLLNLGGDALTIRGKIWPQLEVIGTIDRLSPASFSGFYRPLREVRGALQGNFLLKGSYGYPRLSGELTGKNLSIGNTPLGGMLARYSVNRDSITIDRFMARFSDSEVQLTDGSVIDLSKNTFALKADIRNLHAGPMDFFGGMELDGSWGKDQRNRPVATAVLRTGDNFWVNQHNADAVSFGIDYRNDRVTFIPQSGSPLVLSGSVDIGALPQMRFQGLRIADGRGSRSFTVDGTVGKTAWDFTASGRQLPASVLGEILDMPAPLEGTTDLTVVGRGSPEAPQIEGSLNVSNGKISDLAFDNINLQASVRQDVLTIISARLMKKDQYVVNANGYSPFYLTEDGRRRLQGSPRDISITIDEGDLNIVRGFTNDITASGKLRGQAHITGTLSHPLVNGYVKVANGTVQSKRYVNNVTGLVIDCTWKNNVLTIRECSAKIGEGTSNLKGTVLLDGFQPQGYNLTWQTTGERGISISIPELPIPSPLFKSDEWAIFSNLSHGEPRFSLKLAGPAESPLLSGWIELENTHFTYPPPAKQGVKGESVLDPLWPKLLWNLELRTGKNTWYDNDLVGVNVQGGIRLTGKGATPSASGHIEAIRGDIVYFGTEFKIKQAAIDIVKDACYLEAEAETETYGSNPGDNDTIRMIIDKAEVGKIQPRFISKNDPTLEPEKAMAKATGINPDQFNSTSDMSYFLRKSLIRFFDSTLTTPLAKSFLQKSGLVDSFHVQYTSQSDSLLKSADPENPTLTDLLAGTRYSLEKYVSDRVLLGYSMTLDQIQNKLDLRHEIELSYHINRNLFLKGIYELETNNPLRQFDRRITVEQQWRFGWQKKTKNASPSPQK